MSILFDEKNMTFHLYNDAVSYIIAVLQNVHMAQQIGRSHH